MMKKITFVIVTTLLLASCNRAKIFEQYQDIHNNSWDREQTVSFEVDIEEPGIPYDIDLALRHTTYYAWANVKISYILISPSRSQRIKDGDFFVRNEDGSFRGEGAGDLWDIIFPLYERINLSEKGTYKIEIRNTMPFVTTEDIMQVGLIVRKSKN